MESQDYEHYRNLTLMFFLEKLVDKGGKLEPEIILFACFDHGHYH
jgi:hypothetical protein